MTRPRFWRSGGSQIGARRAARDSLPALSRRFDALVQAHRATPTPASAAEIERFERLTGWVLPDDLRALVSFDNGTEMFVHDFVPIRQWISLTTAVQTHLDVLSDGLNDPPAGSVLAIGQDAGSVLLLEMDGPLAGRLLRFSYRDERVFGQVAASLRDYAECCVRLAKLGWWSDVHRPGVPGRWLARSDADLEQFRRIAARHGATLAIDGTNEERWAQPMDQELQLSIEQPTFSRAHSGRFEAYSPRPGWSS